MFIVGMFIGSFVGFLAVTDAERWHRRKKK
jgi:hypothetical protein